jgi:hypothetical protein
VLSYFILTFITMKCIPFARLFKKRLTLFIMRILTGIALFNLIVGCSTSGNNDKAKENIYAKLMLALGEDSTNKMQCVAEFMKNPDDLKKIALKDGAKLMLDNQELKYDASPYPNYIMERKAADFLGKHVWKIETGPETVQEYEFEVVPFNIVSDIPEKIGTTDLTIECENLRSTDKVFLMLSAEFSENSETSLDIAPQDGFFIIPKDFLKRVDPITIEMHFNISRILSINEDPYFGKGVNIEWTKITKRYQTTVVR